MNYKEYNPQQTQFIGYRPEDVLTEDHFAYLVDEIVEQLDVNKFYDLSPGPGNSAFDPRLMLKIHFLGYATGIFSSRKLEKQCQENLAFIHVTRGQSPKFRAICEFRVRHQEHIKELFPQILQIAKKLKISKLGHLVLDSTKIKANASSSKVVKADKYDDVLKSIDDYLHHAQTQDQEEDKAYGKKSTGQELPPEIRSRRRRAQKIKEIIAQAKKENLAYVNITDPEAKFIKDPNTNKTKPCYNVQVAVDKDSALIVAYDTTDSTNDNEQLEPMIKKAQENTGTKPEKVDTDSGYYNTTSVTNLEKEQIDTCIPDSNTASVLHRGKKIKSNDSNRYTIEDFSYCPDDDSYICPQQKKLAFSGSYKKRKKPVKKYTCQDNCRNCPDRTKCLKKSDAKHRILTIIPDRETLLATKEKFQKEEYRQRYKERATVIERVFGHFKKNLKFRQYYLRGKAKTNVETTLLCIGFNIMVMNH